MNKDTFGTIMYNGKMINLDSENIEKLKNISNELKEKCDNLNKKAENIFNQ